MSLLHSFDVDITPRFNRKLIIILSFIIVPLVVVEIWTMNRLATVGVELSRLDAGKAHLELENTVLRNKISEKKSLAEAERKAREMGYERVSKFEVISGEVGLAQNTNFTK